MPEPEPPPSINAGPRERPPHGLEEILTFYGDIRLYIGEDGTLAPMWEATRLEAAFLPFAIPLGWDHSRHVTRIRVHRRVSWEFWKVFHEIARAGLQGSIRTFDGTFIFRTQRGSGAKLSLHAFGAAIDLNYATNQLGMDGDMDPRVVEIFEGHGFTWGGRWERKDPCHFQFASGY